MLLLILLDCHKLQSQAVIETGYQISQVWQSTVVNLGYRFKNHSLRVGYQLNKDCKPIHDDNNVFKRRFYGRNFLEQSSISANYEYTISTKHGHWNPVLFTSLIYSNAPIMNIIFVPNGHFEDGSVAYTRRELEYEPVEALEFYGGIGLNINILRSLYLYERIGWGYIRYLHFGHENSWKRNAYEFGWKFQLGIGIKFRKKSKSQ